MPSFPQSLIDRLQKTGQSHLTEHATSLTDVETATLAAQLESLPLERLPALMQGEEKGEEIDFDRLEPLPFETLGDGRNAHDVEARARGESAWRAGEIGVVMVAGGQGTRLGYDGPKGTFPIGPLSGATLYEWLAWKVGAVGKRYGRRVPFWIMTSKATHEPTGDYFRQRRYFGLSEDSVVFFRQGEMPTIDDTSGQILLAGRSEVAVNPDGHGGILDAMQGAGLFDRAAEQGIKQLFYIQVDNALAPVADARIVGYHLLAGAEATTLAVRKRDPLEKVGNLVQQGGKTRIVEYSDLPESAARQMNGDGSLAIWAGNTAMHVFSVELLRRAALEGGGLPFHRAHKKTPHLDLKTRQPVDPQTPNAIKFERFIFDALPMATKTLTIEVDPAQVFAPLKNPSGTGKDDPETTKAAISALQRGWLRAAGCDVPDDADVEIQPRVAVDAAATRELVDRLPTRPQGKEILLAD
ncbi:MAG TPA: UTP--glucose-1-phosphate uridylyltransferase [Pirellulaceae bacterium]|jgi:UDP-N-acetylglucosamine/UDP-N-acetylgalactosamine diphosphorylase|nr:UTP--glucose-1-phosphate uridylyltransferase [Pirellulaceae bacterium]